MHYVKNCELVTFYYKCPLVALPLSRYPPQPSSIISKPYKPTSPFQFFLFLSKFLSGLLKKKVFFFVLKVRPSPGVVFDPFLISETNLTNSRVLLKVWAFVLTGLKSNSMSAISFFFHYFFLEFSKKQLPEISKFFSSLKELMLRGRLRGFLWGEKGKVAWKALSRKQKFLFAFGSYSKSNYNLASSESDYTYSSITGNVFFKTSIFYPLFYFSNGINPLTTKKSSNL